MSEPFSDATVWSFAQFVGLSFWHDFKGSVGSVFFLFMVVLAGAGSWLPHKHQVFASA